MPRSLGTLGILAIAGVLGCADSLRPDGRYTLDQLTGAWESSEFRMIESGLGLGPPYPGRLTIEAEGIYELSGTVHVLLDFSTDAWETRDYTLRGSIRASGDSLTLIWGTGDDLARRPEGCVLTFPLVFHIATATDSAECSHCPGGVWRAKELMLETWDPAATCDDDWDGVPETPTRIGWRLFQEFPADSH